MSPESYEHQSQKPSCDAVARNDVDVQMELADLRQTCARQQAQLQEVQVQLIAVLNSTWWRIGEPLRRAGRRFPRLARAFRFTAWSVGKFFYYYKKGVFVERLKDYLQRQRILREASDNNLVKALGLNQPSRLERKASDIVLSTSDKPVVSIIIPAYGHVDVTLRCLASVAAAQTVTPIEVIVVEDASRDPEVRQYRDIKGLRLIEREHNLGFLRSSNDAVNYARGEFILLLNNDTEIIRDAVDMMLRLFRTRPDAGLVGAHLLYPDGRQQEAGGIVWQDGLAWNYGRFDDPRRPEYNYVREVDYISGAAIMMPKALWSRLGGFDEHFMPAYCEDADLAFRVRREGYKVLYQPKALVIHHEGTTHGADTASGLKTYQIENTLKFVERWKDVLAAQQLVSGTRVVRARDRSRDKKVTLVIDHYVPEPDRDGGSRTILTFIEILLTMGRVVKFWPSNNFRSPEYSEPLQQMGVEVLYSPWTTDFEEWIKKNGNEIDEVLLARPMVAPMFLPALRKYSKAPVVFYGVDVHHMRMEKEANMSKDAAKLSAAHEMKQMERRVWLSVDHVLYLSEEEVKAVGEIEPSVRASSIVPCAFENVTVRPAPPPNGTDIIFVGSFRHAPNPDGAIWFCNEIFPRIRAAVPDAKIALIGSSVPTEVQALAARQGVEITGHVSDEELRRRYASARVAVAPLRFGAGVKLKVAEALRYGVPTVTTNVGIQGFEGLDKVIDVCDDAEAFADAVIRLLQDDILWKKRSQAETEYTRQHFSSSAMQHSLESAFTNAAGHSLKAVA